MKLRSCLTKPIDNRCQTHLSRRGFMKLGVAGAAVASHAISAQTPPAQSAFQGPPGQVPRFPKTDVWVQLTTGGKAYPPTLQEMFLDPIFIGINVWPIDQPASFAALLPSNAAAATGARGGGRGAAATAPPTTVAAPAPPGGPGPGRGAGGGGTERLEPADYPWEPSGGRPHPGYDVLVLNDQMDWPEATRALAKQAVEAGRGFVLLHHALGDNQDWPWWYQEVTGGLLVLSDRNGMRKSIISNTAKLDLRPVGTHPILRNIGAFSVTNEQTYKVVWQAAKITPLFQTSNADSDVTVAWVGPHPTAKVVCIEFGTSREAHRHPMFRMLVRNAILWAAGRVI